MTKIKPEDFPWVTTFMTVKDMEKSIDFYEKAFGLKCRKKMTDDDGNIQHAELEYKDGVIMLGPENEQMGTRSTSRLGGSPVGYYLYVEDIDSFHKRAVEAGATSVAPPHESFWGDRMCIVKDHEGLTWSFATMAREMTDEEIEAARKEAEKPAIVGQPQIMERDQFSVVGLSKTWEGTPGPDQIPQLWETFTRRMGEITGRKNEVTYGLCKCEGDSFYYMAGVEVENVDDIPAEMEGKTVPHQQYAVFTHRGPVSKLPGSFDHILNNWLPQSDYEMEKGFQFELYDERFNPHNPMAPDSELDIYIPVKKK